MLSQHLCIHSRVSANLIRDFDTAWHLDGALNLSPYDDEKDRVEIFHSRENSSVRSQTLALVFRKQKISLIYSSSSSFCLPYDIIPIYDDNNVCKEHGNRFIADDSGLGTSQ